MIKDRTPIPVLVWITPAPNFKMCLLSVCLILPCFSSLLTFTIFNFFISLPFSLSHCFLSLIHQFPPSSCLFLNAFSSIVPLLFLTLFLLAIVMPSCPFSYFLCFFWHLPSNFVLFVHHSLTIKFLLFKISSPLTLYIPFPLFLASFQLFNLFRFFLSCYVPLKFLPHSLCFIVTPSSPTSPLAPLHPLFTFLTTQFLWVFITCVTFHFLFHLNLILFLCPII